MPKPSRIQEFMDRKWFSWNRKQVRKALEAATKAAEERAFQAKQELWTQYQELNKLLVSCGQWLLNSPELEAPIEPKPYRNKKGEKVVSQAKMDQYLQAQTNFEAISAQRKHFLEELKAYAKQHASMARLEPNVIELISDDSKAASIANAAILQANLEQQAITYRNTKMAKGNLKQIEALRTGCLELATARDLAKTMAD